MSSTVALQWLTFAAYIALVGVCLWGSRRASARMWGVFWLTWAVNGAAFYLSYLVFHGGVLDAQLIGWSAATRLHGIALVAGSIVLLGRNGRSHDA